MVFLFFFMCARLVLQRSTSDDVVDVALASRAVGRADAP